MPDGHRIAGVGVSSSVKKVKKNIQVPPEDATIVEGARSASIVKIVHSLVPSLTGALYISSTPLLGWDFCELMISCYYDFPSYSLLGSSPGGGATFSY